MSFEYRLGMSGGVEMRGNSFLDKTLGPNIPEQEEALFLHLQSSEQACEEYLFHLKWPNGFVCPHCGHGHAYTIQTRKQPLYECAKGSNYFLQREECAFIAKP